MGLQRKGSTVARHHCYCYIILVNQSQLFQLSKLRLCLDCIVPPKKNILPGNISISMSEFAGRWFAHFHQMLNAIVSVCRLRMNLWQMPIAASLNGMQYFLNDKDESSQFSPGYMFCDCFWPHCRTIQGWRSFSAQPECPFSFFWPSEECQPVIVLDPAVQAQSRLSMFSSLSSFQVLAPIINVFKLDSGQLKWVFVLQAWST